MTIAQGDVIAASVAVDGDDVTVSLTDRTAHETFTKTTVDHTIDISSAEWIAEAPSNCTSSSNCTTLPLTDFGDVEFDRVDAVTTVGHRASILNSAWRTTRILLVASARRHFAADSAALTATPSVLDRAGRSFSVAVATSSNGGATGSGTDATGGSGTGTGGAAAGSVGSGAGEGAGATGPSPPGAFRPQLDIVK